MAIVLFITTNDEKTIEMPLLGKCTLGRSSNCDLTINDKQMSGKHGIFELNARGEVFYTDLGSTNGSYLNNSQIQKIQFKVSEKIRLGNTVITIDEKRLNSKERLAIGRGLATSKDNTIVMPASKGTKSQQFDKIAENEDGANHKNSVILNKDLKKNVPKSNWVNGKKESLIEQEKSSGSTQLLKLDINKKIKKK
ncbi:MAG: FHA domain-containing protein [Bacteriovorax sp.]|nr:FHA domain-containing protein [Bacteriovorax sp.]